MQNQSDATLLIAYAHQGSEAAFGEIVARHADLVYSAALRQVQSPDLAREVAQSVFIDLARKARDLTNKLLPDASLVGWLYRSTWFAALNFLREDRRRQTRERQSMDVLNPNRATSEPPVDWAQLQPLLDEAMSGLAESDREALLLRFFKNQDFRAVGVALGISDDAAQKRVSRAVEKLRQILVRRGITASGAILATTISAHAVQIAPAGLVTGISKAALLAGAAFHSALLIQTKAIVMTTLQKALLGVTVAVLAGTGVYQAHRAVHLNAQLDALQQKQTPLTAQLRQLQRERDDATERVASMSAELAALQANSGELLKLRAQVSELKSQNANLTKVDTDAAQVAARSWADRVTQLKQRLERTPGAAIPEFKYLGEVNWLNAARDPLNTDEDYRRAFSSLRSAGENQFIMVLQKALSSYLSKNNGEFPSDLSQLKPYFEAAPDDAMLQRYAIVPAASVPNLKMGGDWLITVKNPVDEEYDSLWGLGPNGFGNTTFRGTQETSALAPARDAYRAANNGQDPKNASDLLPYLTTPEQLTALQKLEQMRKGEAK